MKYKNRAIAVLLAAVLLGAGILALAVGYGLGGKASSQVRITEICAKNETILADNSGKYRDYIELYAPREPISLKGYTLTDGEHTSAPLGDITIGAGEYRVLFLDGKTLGFSLDAAGGDTLRLLAPDGRVAAQANTMAMEADQVMAWTDGHYKLTGQATPNFPNTAQGLAAFREGAAQEDPKLVISEVLTSNETTLPDELGVFSDVVELHNVSEESVYLGSFFLSDRKTDRFAYRLPDMVLEAGGYVVIYCDAENYISDTGHIHANFGLSRGENLYLSDSQGGFVEVFQGSAAEDVSWQLSEGEYTAGVPSLGFENTPEGAQQAMAQRTDPESNLIISEVILASSGVPYGGVVSDFVEITNRSLSSVSTQGWYLSDGGDPYEYPLPAQILQPGESLVIRCDETGAGFGLAAGETVLLTGPDHRYAPVAVCTEAEPGLSMQAQPEEEQFWVMAQPTPGYPNTAQGRQSYLEKELSQSLRISEVMPRNESYLPGPYGYCCGWIELYNAGTKSVNLKDYSLCTLGKAWDQYPLPDMVLEPGRYTVILADDSGEATKRGYSVIPLALSKQGQGLYLSRGGAVEDYAILPAMTPDTSFGRGRESSEMSLLAQATPGTANAAASAPSGAPVALTAPGSYDNTEYLDIVLQGPGEMYYTTNCTLPDRSSTPYTGPIRITKTTILRVVCYEPGKDASAVADFSYFLNENDALSVVSLVTEPDNLFSSSKGIYVAGYNAQPTSPYTGANFWQDWERPATVTLIDTDGTVAFSQGCGIKIFGAYSRMNEKKSFACMFRARYGAGKLEYPVFGEESLPYYESLVLRAGGQDIYWARMRDEMITSLAGEYLGLPVQDYRPVSLYLNGQFWGVYYIREKLSDQYVAGHYNMNAEDVKLCQVSETGLREYVEVTRYARSHDLSRQEHFDYIASRVDLENYTDYMIAQMWINNTDSSNVKFFMNAEGKWTWALFDTDMSFSNPGVNTIYQHLKTAGDDVICRTLLLRLLNNDAYRDYFLERMAWQINNLWTEENINRRVDEIYSLIQQDMQKDTQRWNKSYEYWKSSVEGLRSFAARRNQYFVGYVKSYFHLSWEQMREYGFPVPED